MKVNGKFKLALLLIAASFIVSGTADARNGRLRQRHQNDRIKNGVESGALTPNETEKLRAEQKAVRATRKEARSDGHIDKEERKDLRKMQKKASRHIAKAKHNKKTKDKE